MKKLFAILLGCILFCGMLPVQAATAEEDAELTLMVYITGSDLESGSGAATGDIAEMLRSGVDLSKVNILLMTGGSSKWWGGFPSDQLCIYKVEGRRPTPLEQMPSVSMGEAGTLSFFLNYGYQNYSAEKYALILWDHGGGPMNGVCYDELFSQSGMPDQLSLMELKDALTDSPFSAEQPLEWIGFDACLMSAVETAHICAPFARYMIASQETEPGTGWNYSFLAGVNGDCTGADVGRMIIDSYFSNTRANAALTLSCIDLSRIGAVEDALNNLFGQLDQIISPESFSTLSNSRREARSIGRVSTGSDYDLVDLCHLAMQYEQHAPDAARQLQDAVKAAVVHQESNIENTYGLSVYYPYYNKIYFTALWMDIYSDLDFADSYRDYMADYADLWLSEALADWSNLRTAALPALEDNVQTLTMSLTEEQLAHFSSAELYILDEFPSGGGYYDIYHTNDVRLENGELAAEYDYRALYALDADGNPISDALTYVIQDDAYLVRAVLAEKTSQDDYFEWLDSELKPVYLQCVLNEENDELEIVGVLALPDSEAAFAYPSEEVLLLSGKQTANLDSDDWPFINFVRYPRVLAAEDDGAVLAYPDWPYPPEAVEGYVMLEYYEIDNTRPWTLKFCEQQYGGRSLLAQYVVSDTQGNRFGGDLLPIENLNLESNAELNITLEDNDDYTIRLTGVDVVNAERDSGLYVYGVFENHTGEDFSLRAENFFFEQTALGIAESISAATFAGDGISPSQNFHVFIPACDFPPMADTDLETFRFDLHVVSSEAEDVQIVPVEYGQPVDLCEIVALYEPVEPLAVTSVDGGSCELLSLSEEEEGLAARLHIVNNGNSELKLDWYACDAAINHCIFTGGFAGKAVQLPAGCDQYIDVRFRRATPAKMLFDSMLPEVDGFDYWKICEVENLTVGDDCTFVLSDPFAVGGTPASEPRQALLATDEVTIELQSVTCADNVLTAEFALANHTGAEVRLYMENVRLNGADAEASCCYEVNPCFGDCWTVPAGSQLRGGLIIEIVDETPEILELSFRYDVGDGADCISTAAVIDCAASTVLESAEMIRNDPIDPMCWIDPEVILPGNSSGYGVTLTAQLTDEQAADFDRASAALIQYVPDRGAYRLYYLKHDVSLGDEGLLSVDYNGLLVCANGQTHPFVAVQQASGENISILGAALSSGSYQKEDLQFDALSLGISDDFSSAAIESAVVSRTVYELEQFYSLNLTYYTRLPVYGEDGTLAHVLDWSADSMYTGQGYTLQDGQACFSMIPTEDIHSLYVLFSIYNTDGTGYSLEPIPYADACAAG